MSQDEINAAWKKRGLIILAAGVIGALFTGWAVVFGGTYWGSMGFVCGMSSMWTILAGVIVMYYHPNKPPVI